jgi:hypothetical protein
MLFHTLMKDLPTTQKHFPKTELSYLISPSSIFLLPSAFLVRVR